MERAALSLDCVEDSVCVEEASLPVVPVATKVVRVLTPVLKKRGSLG